MRFYTNARVFGNDIFLRGIEDGKQFFERHEYHPTLYIPSQKDDSKWRSLDGRTLSPIKPGTIRDCKQWASQYEDIEGFEIFGNERWEYAFLSEEFPQQSISYDQDQITIANIDIEVDSSNGFPHADVATEKVTAITMKVRNHVYAFGYGDFKTDRDDVTYVKCKDEYLLLKAFMNTWIHYQPEIVTGWNIDGFDIPYLVNRITKLFGEKIMKKLSPWGKVFAKTMNGAYGNEYTTYDIVGVSSLDYLAAYKKFTYSEQSSYKLNHIAFVELGEEKISYEEEYNNLHTLQKENHQLFIEYNIKDVELVDRLEDKKSILKLIIQLAYQAKINFNDPFRQVRMWDCLIYNKLKARRIIIPYDVESKPKEKYAGAYVKEPIPKMYRWIASFDLNSLYPHLMMQYNISPDTFINPDLGDFHDPDMIELAESASVDALLNMSLDLSPLKEHGVTMTPNGQFFRVDKTGFMSEMMKDLYSERKAIKKKMLEYEQLAEQAETEEEKKKHLKAASNCDIIQLGLKVTLNSAYGAFGNNHFRFYDKRMAEAVTLAGQLSIRWIERSFNGYLNRVLKTDGVDYVPYIDTDSNYVSLEGLVNQVFGDEQSDVKKIIRFMDKVCEQKLQPLVNESYQNLANYVNAAEQKMIMAREVLADTGFWTKKKRYALNVHNSEGVQYKEPKVKIMGLEVVRSSTPQMCRDGLKETITTFLNAGRDEVMEVVERERKAFMQARPEDVAKPGGVNGLEKYRDARSIAKRGAPGHVRASLVYNHLIKKHGLEKKYPLINSGDKVKMIYLKSPNPIHEKAIAFPEVLPPEFGLDNYVDRKLQFEKNFESPLEAIFATREWGVKDEASLEDFFC